jgi:hypothetical protein
MISTRSVGLVIDTVVCLTLDKWETVSGQFGGYLREEPGAFLMYWSSDMGNSGLRRCERSYSLVMQPATIPTMATTVAILVMVLSILVLALTEVDEMPRTGLKTNSGVT